MPCEVHVGDPSIDVPTAAAHFVEPGGLHAPFLPWPPDDRVEPDVRVLAVFVTPHLTAVLGFDDARCSLGQRGGNPTLEHVGRLDDVVVDGDQNVMAVPGTGVRQQRHSTTIAIYAKKVKIAIEAAKRAADSGPSYATRRGSVVTSTLGAPTSVDCFETT